MPSEVNHDGNVIPLYKVVEEEFELLHDGLPLEYQKAKQAIIDKLEEQVKEANEREDKINDELLTEIYRAIHRLDGTQAHAALCLSGGGIRSATFGLGVLQGLAKHNLLDKFAYLSTVSGGGYIGSWLSAWIHRHPNGTQGVVGDLKTLSGSKIDPECEPIRGLREFSNYLTPKMGLLSADTWTWIATYLRNVVLNWLILIPLMAAVIIIPPLCVTVISLDPDGYFGTTAIFAGWHWHFGLFSTTLLMLGCILAVIGIDYVDSNLPTTGTNRDQEAFLLRCLLPFLTSAVALTTAWAWFCNAREAPGSPQVELSWQSFAIFGAVLHLVGCAAYLRRAGEKSRWVRLKEVFSKRGVEQLIIIVLAGAVGGILVWLFATKTRLAEPIVFPEFFVTLASPILLTLFLLATALYIGFASYSTSDADREWWSRAGGWFLIAILVWIVLSWLVLFGPQVVIPLNALGGKIVTAVGGLSGLITILIGKDAATPANTKQEEKASLMDKLQENAVTIAAPIFAAFLVILISFGIRWVVEALGLHPSPVMFGVGIAVLLAVSLSLGYFVNINKFSLNGAYRDRIIRAYLGASRPERTPNKFTGFDPADNMPMHKLAKGERTNRFEKPLHMINVALNLVKGENLAWQERKAESFTFSALHAGSFRLGYRKAKEYGGEKGLDGGNGISLGTAVSISGAAASPNMGYHSSPLVTFFLALFNVRLGWWLGNPGKAGDETFRKRGPKFAVGPLIKETFGLTDENSPYVYLSDGGHFENLGLYEMVVRRCKLIVVSDAGCDPDCSLEDLGNAIRKVRIDLGVPITFEKFDIYSRNDTGKPPLERFAVGRIHYSAVDGGSAEEQNGTLIYVKPAFYSQRQEPLDVCNYATLNKTFPHQTTADQWFTESQFESYRMLGLYTVDQVLREMSQNKDQPAPDGFLAGTNVTQVSR